jgi:hypothetical protein
MVTAVLSMVSDINLFDGRLVSRCTNADCVYTAYSDSDYAHDCNDYYLV